MKSYINIIFLFLLYFSTTAVRADSYEWYQLTEQGIINKIVTPNKAASDFTDLKIEKKLLSRDEVEKKFPNLSHPKTIALFGDTGCRILESKVGGSTYQDCRNQKVWPFALITQEVLKDNPDLVIHLGDYLYRESCGEGKPCEKLTSASGYGFSPWELDFLSPMKALFAKVPIIIVRGNHEDCSRAYLGYRYLFSNHDWKTDCEEFEPAQVITLGDTAIVNFDSSDISEIPLSQNEKVWVKRLDDINEKLEKLKIKKVWLVSHKPMYGIMYFKLAMVPGNLNFKNFFEKSTLKDKVTAVFGGHLHTAMLVIPKKAPKQIISGNGGTQLLEFNKPITKDHLDSFGYQNADLVTKGFGYVLLKRNDKNLWTIIFKNTEGKEIASFPL